MNYSRDPYGRVMAVWAYSAQLVPPVNVASMSYDTGKGRIFGGRLDLIRYPGGQQVSGSSLVDVARAEDDWQYNDLGQLSAAGGATGATYWPGSALKQLVLGSWTESRSYNVSGQLTQQQVPGVLNIEYGFSATQNDGRIEWRKDNGVRTSYGYDDLGRLTGATAPSWGMSFSYDGFGNRTAQSATAGSVPTWSQSIDPATNRILGGGYAYDTVGNMITAPGIAMTYDMAGRMTAAGTANYWYDAMNRRVWKQTSTKTEFFFYGPKGMMLGVFEHKCPSAGCHFDGTTSKLNFYFGGRLVKSGAKWY